MGKRGPARKPTQLAILHGDQPCRVNMNTPQPNDAPLEPPDGMSDAAREIWDYTVAQLNGMHIATAADRDVLASYCEAIVIQQDAAESIRRDGLLVPGAKGGLVKNPAVAMHHGYTALIRVLAREFGLTPSARSEITANGSNSGGGSGAERYLS
jgi:P27 family predicted phage terminase small subunit